MQTIRITTAQNIDIDYEVAGLGERILARLIDYALFLAIYLIYQWIFGKIEYESVLLGYTLPEILYFVFYIFYDLVAEVLFNGQSLGKYILKIKVVSLDGGRPRFGQYLLRYIFRIADFLITLNVAAIISVAVTEKKQRIGDIVANTTLIKTKPNKQFQDIALIEIDELYQPVFLEALNLSDYDIALIREVLNQYNKTGEIALVDSMANKILAYLKISLPPDFKNFRFLNTVLKDYNHLSVKTEMKTI